MKPFIIILIILALIQLALGQWGYAVWDLAAAVGIYLVGRQGRNLDEAESEPQTPSQF